MPDTLRLASSATGVYYVPEYLARVLGYFGDEGLTVETTAPGGTHLLNMLSSGEADLALGGAWRPLMYWRHVQKLPMFAMLCIRNPQILVSRRPVRQFAWTDLQDRTVILLTDPSPWMFLEAILKKADVDLTRVRFIRDLQANETGLLFRAGIADYILAMPPAAEVLMREGYHAAITIADAGGRVPWSVYYALPEFLERPDQPAVRFARAITRALNWLVTHDPDEAPEMLDQHFGAIGRETAAQAIRSARRRGVWADNIRIPEDPLARWQQTIVNYGLVDAPIPYDEIVDNRVADALGAPR